MPKFIQPRFHYPKLLLFGACIVLAYILFRNHSLELLAESLNHHGYAAIFLAGCLFSYGFTSPFAIALFLELGHQVNIGFAAPLAGLGALISDFLIFSWVRFSMKDEFHSLSLSKPIQWVMRRIKKKFAPRTQKILGWAFAGFIIASPFPDEIGVSLLSGFGNIDKRMFALIVFGLNTTGIALILLLSQPT